MRKPRRGAVATERGGVGVTGAGSRRGGDLWLCGSVCCEIPECSRSADGIDTSARCAGLIGSCRSCSSQASACGTGAGDVGEYCGETGGVECSRVRDLSERAGEGEAFLRSGRWTYFGLGTTGATPGCKPKPAGGTGSGGASAPMQASGGASLI